MSLLGAGAQAAMLPCAQPFTSAIAKTRFDNPAADIQAAMRADFQVVPPGVEKHDPVLLEDGVLAPKAESARAQLSPDQHRAYDLLLIAASMKGDTKEMSRLLALGADPEAREDHGNSALMYAAYAGNRAAVSLLLQRRADPNVGNACGVTPLISAAGRRDDPVLVRSLLDAGANPSAKSRLGCTALGNAIVTGHDQVAKLLIKRGADLRHRIYAAHREYTFLMLAGAAGRTEVGKALVDAGAPVDDITGSESVTALMMTAGQGNAALAQYLVQKGANVRRKDASDLTAADWAALFKHRWLETWLRFKINGRRDY